MHDYTLIYDDNCPLCQRTTKWLKDKSDNKIITFIPLSNISTINCPNIPDHKSLMKEVYLFDKNNNRWLAGPYAIAELLEVTSNKIVLKYLLNKKLTGWLVRLVYRVIARQRQMFSKQLPLPDDF